MGEFIGEPGAWKLQCTLSLASCRLRAESLARRVHSKLWTRYDGSGSLRLHGVYEDSDEPESGTIRINPHERLMNGDCSWRSAATAMFAAATINSTSIDDEEYYDCEGRFSSPPSPADEQEIIVNPPVGLPPVPGLESLEELDEETKEYEFPKEDSAILKTASNNKMVTNNEILYEKLILIADSLNLSAQQAAQVEEDIVEASESADENSDSLLNGATTYKSEKTFEPVADEFESVPLNGDLDNSESVEVDSAVADVTVDTLSSSPKSPSPTKFKFSVTPVVEDVSLVQDDSSVKPSSSIDSVVSLSLDDTLTPSLSEYDDDDDYDEPSQRVLLRSTSLKTGKTPPGTPRRKKIVRFADALGLDLEAVRHIVNDDLPNVPASAFNDLKLSECTNRIMSTSRSSNSLPANNRVLYPQFAQPVTDPYFLERIRTHKVCLENVVVSGLSIYGVVRVLNICFEKTVLVRYTTDDWRTFYEVPSTYVPDSNDGFSDRFRFTLHQPGLSPGQRLVIAVRYIAAISEFWDNNYGHNYILKCHSPASNSVPTSDSTFSFI